MLCIQDETAPVPDTRERHVDATTLEVGSDGGRSIVAGIERGSALLMNDLVADGLRQLLRRDWNPAQAQNQQRTVEQWHSGGTSNRGSPWPA